MYFAHNGVPLYLQLYEQLKKNIINKKWLEGVLIPSETVLMKDYDVGRETVRRAVLRLVGEGYLYRQRGKGTFVCRELPTNGLEHLLSFTSEMKSRGYRPGTDVLGYDLRLPTPKIQKMLSLKSAEKVIYIKRLRYTNEVPVAVEESFFNKDIFGTIEKEKLSTSFYEYLFYEKGIGFGKVMQEISSILADKQIASLLQVNPGHPILQMTRLIHTTNNRPFFYLIFRFRGDIYSVKTSLDPVK